jgi:cyclopropane-fatty-acyl-phospholipid synthase
MIPDINAPPRTYQPPRSRLERFACKALFRFMLSAARIQFEFGFTPDRNNSIAAEFIVASPKLWPTIKLMVAPNLWVGESYVAGSWYLIKGSLSDFLNVVEHEARQPFKSYYQFISKLRGVGFYLRQYILNRHYTRQVKRHYEVDPKIYEMILDNEMFYTCAFFVDGDECLSAAQQNKANITVERMSLRNGPVRVLDIGCGWGGMLRSIVKRHNQVEVCGLSISSSQIEWAKKRDDETLSRQQADRMEYRLEDYVDHERRDYYDAISIIGMIEHVGLGGYDEFFGKIHDFLKPGGTAVVHTIVSPLPAIPTNSWIDRHIFTGGYSSVII